LYTFDLAKITKGGRAFMMFAMLKIEFCTVPLLPTVKMLLAKLSIVLRSGSRIRDPVVFDPWIRIRD
jgi:hypothetical protein